MTSKEKQNNAEQPGWAEEEFGKAELGDKRLTRRLVRLARQRGGMPNATIPQSSQDQAGVRAAYRFYDNEHIQMEQIIEPHVNSTIERLKGQAVVLAVQDTTEVNLSHHPHTAGLGYLQDLEHHGYYLHTTLMVTPQRVPLGIVQAQIWVRDEADFGKKHKRHARETKDKESQKWLNSIAAVAEVQKKVPGTQLVSVGDSEADVYALYARASELNQPFLVRCCRDRLILNRAERHLWTQVEQLPAAGSIEVAIPAQDKRPARTALLTVRFMAVELKVPVREAKHAAVAQVRAWAIWVKEETPPSEVKAIEWKLLTNVPTDDFAQACVRIAWYSCRWVIEMFHRILKSGCLLEERQFDDLENIQRYLAVDSVVAWRVLYLTLLSRETPKMSCESILEAYEWQALYCFVHKTRKFPPLPPTLEEVVRWISQLGGFTASKKHQPGTTVLWLGLQRLADIAQAWLVFYLDT